MPYHAVRYILLLDNLPQGLLCQPSTFELATYRLTRRVTPDVLGALALVHAHIVYFELGRERERSRVNGS
jgi:hypothetical protein